MRHAPHHRAPLDPGLVVKPFNTDKAFLQSVLRGDVVTPALRQGLTLLVHPGGGVGVALDGGLGGDRGGEDGIEENRGERVPEIT